MSVDFHHPWLDSWLGHHLTTAGNLSYHSQGRHIPILTGKSFLNNDRILDIDVILWLSFALVMGIYDSSYLGINSCLYLEIGGL